METWYPKETNMKLETINIKDILGAEIAEDKIINGGNTKNEINNI